MTESSPYVLGAQITAEGERLLQQCRGLEREARWLLDRVGVQPGWRAVDVGCGPLGVLDLLAERVGPDGEVVGLEREARLVALGETLLKQRDLSNVRFVLGDAYATGLPRGAFDLAHARLLLINLTDPGRALAEIVALVRPGGVVAVQDIDQVPWLCEPPHPAWDGLVGAFLQVWRANGLDPLIGRRLPALLRAAGLVDVEVEVHGRADPPGAYHRKHLVGIIEAIRNEIVEQGLFTEQEGRRRNAPRPLPMAAARNRAKLWFPLLGTTPSPAGRPYELGFPQNSEPLSKSGVLRNHRAHRVEPFPLGTPAWQPNA